MQPEQVRKSYDGKGIGISVNAINGKGIDLQAAPDTRLRGDISIDGLPDIEQTLFDLDLTQLTATTAEIEQLIGDGPGFAGFHTVIDGLGNTDRFRDLFVC